MAALLDAATAPDYGASVVAVGADRDGTGALARAHQAGVPTFVTRFADFPDRVQWNTALADTIARFAPDLVVSAGFMRLLGPEVLGRYTVVNTHPALLPACPGANAVRDALDYGMKVTGATVHFVDEGVDTGPVIDQGVVRVAPDDDVDTLHERIKTVERRMLVEVVDALAQGGWTIVGRHVRLETGASHEPGYVTKESR